MHVEHDMCAQLAGTGDGRVEVVDLEPDHHPIAHRFVRVAHVTMVVVDIARMQLEDQPVAAPACVVQLRVVEPLVVAWPLGLVAATTITQRAAEQALVEARRCLDVTNHEEGLRSHRTQASQPFAPCR